MDQRFPSFIPMNFLFGRSAGFTITSRVRTYFLSRREATNQEPKPLTSCEVLGLLIGMQHSGFQKYLAFLSHTCVRWSNEVASLLLRARVLPPLCTVRSGSPLLINGPLKTVFVCACSHYASPQNPKERKKKKETRIVESKYQFQEFW